MKWLIDPVMLMDSPYYHIKFPFQMFEVSHHLFDRFCHSRSLVVISIYSISRLISFWLAHILCSYLFQNIAASFKEHRTGSSQLHCLQCEKYSANPFVSVKSGLKIVSTLTHYHSSVVRRLRTTIGMNWCAFALHHPRLRFAPRRLSPTHSPSLA